MISFLAFILVNKYPVNKEPIISPKIIKLPTYSAEPNIPICISSVSKSLFMYSRATGKTP